MNFFRVNEIWEMQWLWSLSSRVGALSKNLVWSFWQWDEQRSVVEMKYMYVGISIFHIWSSFSFSRGGQKFVDLMMSVSHNKLEWQFWIFLVQGASKSMINHQQKPDWNLAFPLFDYD